MLPFLTATIVSFGWSRCAIIASSQAYQSSLAVETKIVLEQAGVTVFYHIINPVWHDDHVSDSKYIQGERQEGLPFHYQQACH